MSFKNDLRIWAADTADLYHELATSNKDCNLGFYTQSNLTRAEMHPELLILAINPGFNGAYLSGSDDKYGLVDNERWIEWGVRNKRMDGDTLLKGNAFWGERDKWALWRRLRSILGYGELASLLDDESKFVFTNMILFNTYRAREIPAIAFKDCPEKTIELIEILQPRRILCLGKNDCFNLFCKRTKLNPAELIPSELSYVKWKDIPVFGIPHTSKYYSHEEMSMIGKCLGYMFGHEAETFSADSIQERFADDIKLWRDRKSTPSLSRKLSEEVAENITKEWELVQYDSKHPERYLLPCGLSLTVTKQGYVAIRHKDYFRQYTDTSDYPHQQELIELLKGYEYTHTNVWLGQKSFKKYGRVAKVVIEEIVKEVNELCSKLNNYNWD